MIPNGGNTHVDAAYERRSLILTSNLHTARNDAIFAKGPATAPVDRHLRHAHVIVPEGRSHRLSEALEGRGAARLEAPPSPE
ncbi:MAG: ATP-binding protein [Chloroflexota bacterium]|nr:ATP-binding protein [Chloroflexota bacterium]